MSNLASRFTFVIILAAWAAACSSDATPQGTEDAATPDDSGAGDVAPDAPITFESRPAGAWYAGDMHVHATGASNDTGGNSTPERIKEVGVARGLDWLVLTDHSNSTGSDPTTRDEDPALFNMGPEFPYWERAAELTDPDFLFIDGNELSPVAEGEIGPTGHVGCTPRDLETFDTDYVFVDRPRGAVTGGEALRQATEAGCFTTLNHPYAIAPWIAFDWTSFDYDAIEVYNGTAGWDQGDFAALEAWACDHAAGRRPVAVGGSDNHRIEIEPPGTLTDPPLAQPSVWVWADRLEWPAIMGGLDAGRVSVTDDGAPIELDAHAADGRWLGMMGDRVDETELAFLRLSGSVDSVGKERVVRLYRIGPGECDDPRAPHVRTVPEPRWEIVWEATLADGDTFEEIVAVSADAGDVFFVYKGPDDSRGIQHFGVGFTNAIRTQ